MDTISLSDLNLNHYSDLEEISLSHELAEMISGTDFGVQKFIPYVHRKIRRDPDTDDVQYCVCWDELANEGQLGCPYCDGIGMIWDETIIPGFMFLTNRRKVAKTLNANIEAGRVHDYELAFITEAQYALREQDRLYLPLTTDEGFIKWPIVFQETYFIMEILKQRMDFGSHEYTLAFIGTSSI